MKKIDIEKLPTAKVYNRKNDSLLLEMHGMIAKTRFRINRSAGLQIGLDSKTSWVEFIEIGDEWFLCFTNNQLDGYKVTLSTPKDKKRSGYECNSFRIVRKICAKLAPGKDRCKVQFIATQFEFKGRPLFKILKLVE